MDFHRKKIFKRLAANILSAFTVMLILAFFGLGWRLTLVPLAAAVIVCTFMPDRRKKSPGSKDYETSLAERLEEKRKTSDSENN